MSARTPEGPHMTTHQRLSYDEFVSLATADPAVVGLVLKGSRAHDGMATRRSDHDLYVVLADGAATGLARFTGHRSPELDLVVLPSTRSARRGGPRTLRPGPCPRRARPAGRGHRPRPRRQGPAGRRRGVHTGRRPARRLRQLPLPLGQERPGRSAPRRTPRRGRQRRLPAGAAVHAGPLAPPLQQVPALGAGPVPAARLGHGRPAGRRGPDRGHGRRPRAAASVRPGRGGGAGAGLGAVLDAWRDDLALMRPGRR